jgi:lipoprotein signal peptidase
LENVGAAFGFIKKIQGIPAILTLFGLSMLWSLVATGVADVSFYPSLLIS